MVPVQCFLIVATGLERVSLRRYRSGGTCSGSAGYHDARVVVVAELAEDAARRLGDDAFRGDARWPAACACGEPFVDDDARQVFAEALYRREDGQGALFPLRSAVPGALYDAPWYPEKGPDGLALVAVCPDGHPWFIDGRARNCTLPDDNVHRCWVRTGVPPLLTVGKSGGPTCSAGAGSIDTGTWHGFLRDGQFVQ